MARSWSAWGAVAAVVLYLAYNAAARGSAAAPLVTNTLQVLAPAVAAVAAAAASRRATTPQHRFGWQLAAAASTAWALGQAAWTWYEANGDEVPFPSLADAGYLPAVPLLAGALILLGPRVGPATRMRILLDGVLTAALLLFVMWIVVLRGMVAQATEGNLALAIAIAYPLGDVVMAAVVLNVATRAPANDRSVWTALALGVAGWALADSGFAYLATQGDYGTGDWIDVGWFGGFLAVAVAADLARREPLADQSSDALRLTNLGVPWALMGLALVLAMREQVVRGVLEPFLLWEGVFAVTLLLARQVVSQVEVRRLNRRLQEANHDLASMLQERQRSEQTRAELEAARRQTAFKTEFLNNAAHELATPLTPIRLEIGVLESLVEESGDTDAQRHVVVLARNFERLSRLVHDLLLSARLDLDRLVLRRERVDLWRIVREAAEDEASHARSRGVALEVEPPAAGESFPVDVDAGRMAQVASNLLSNAVKFTPAGGHVWVRVWRDGAHAVAEVRDDGIGFTAEQQGRLFQPFMAVHAHGPTVQSTGLGLYIAKGLVEHHGGVLESHSAGEGRGSRFLVRIPLADGPGPAPGAAFAPSPSPATGPRS